MPETASFVLREELFATWFATAILMSVLGMQIAQRTADNEMRLVIDSMFLGLGCVMLLWAVGSFCGVFSFRVHRLLLLLLCLTTAACLVYALVISTRGDL